MIIDDTEEVWLIESYRYLSAENKIKATKYITFGCQELNKYACLITPDNSNVITIKTKGD